MDLVTRSPSAVAVLRAACTVHMCGDRPQCADSFVSLAQAAEMLDAPAGVELQATNALEESLGADSAYWAFVAAADEQTRRRLDLDLALADFHAWRSHPARRGRAPLEGGKRRRRPQGFRKLKDAAYFAS